MIFTLHIVCLNDFVNKILSIYLQVRCLMDHGEFETQDGNIVVLKKNSQVSYNIYQISLKIKIEMVDNIAKHKMNLFSDKPQHFKHRNAFML